VWRLWVWRGCFSCLGPSWARMVTCESLGWSRGTFMVLGAWELEVIMDLEELSFRMDIGRTLGGSLFGCIGPGFGCSRVLGCWKERD